MNLTRRLLAAAVIVVVSCCLDELYESYFCGQTLTAPPAEHSHTRLHALLTLGGESVEPARPAGKAAALLAVARTALAMAAVFAAAVSGVSAYLRFADQLR